jgi:GWxTD domain-containing protein
MLNVLIEATLRATLIAAIVLFALPLLRVRSAAVRHRVWTVVLVAMLALPVWIIWAPGITLRVLPRADAGGPNAAAAPSLLYAVPARDAMVPPTTARERPEQEIGASAPAIGVPNRSSWRTSLLAVYLAGVAALLLRLAIGTARMRELVEQARLVNGRLTSARIATPFTVGLFHSNVLFPEGWHCWPEARLAVALEHERAHVRRRDPLVQWFSLLNRALFWFHPLAWWLERRLAALAEEACDAAVLARGHAPEAYSEHLLEFARVARGQVPYAAAVPMPGSALPARIAKILEGGVARPGSRLAVTGAAVLATLVAFAIGAITLAQESTPLPLTPPADSVTPLPEHWYGDDEWHLEVAPLMTPEENEVYRALGSMEERDRFIGAFWLRRDPTPGTLHNEFKKEYERRVHYADQWFRDSNIGAQFGYQTTRGAVHVLLGQPDSIEAVVEDGESYEYWRYSDVNSTGEAFAVRIALSPRIGCGPAYEIVEPAPSKTFLGFAGLGQTPPRPLAVHVYPFGLVTFSIPIDWDGIQGVRTTLERPAGTAPIGFGFEFRLAPGLPAAKRSITALGQQGLNCTVPIPPGDYRLVAEADLASGEHLTDSVAFQVDAP